MVDFLADENIHADIVAWLRAKRDVDLLAIARQEQLVLITDDKDFGELVFHRRLASAGVVLIRLHGPTIVERLDRLAQAWPAIEGRAAGCFIVISDSKIRIRTPLDPP